MKTSFLAVLLLCVFLPRAYTQVTITVNAAKRIKTLTGIENGINLDYLMDGGFTNPSVPASTSLKNMGVKLLRYPGGEKSDNYLWSAAPWQAASPRMALLDTVDAWPTRDDRFVDKQSAQMLCKPVVLDFDELMTVCKTTGAQPLIVVAYDAMYNTITKVRPTKAQLLKNATEWVRYANITKKFGIKYWMIGNESWNLPDYNGRVTATQYAADLYEFAAAMKAIDPTIKIIANGWDSWWPTLLKSKAVSLIDILGFSLYPVHNYTAGYETYRASNRSLTREIDNAIRAIETYAPAAEKKRLKVLASEYGSIDFGGGWSNENNLGHALYNFQLFGDMVVNPKVESACLWNTRWTENNTEEQHLFDALDKNGNLNATGVAQQVWGNHLLNSMVACSSSNSQVKTYASYDTATQNLNIFILNKDTAAKDIRLSLEGYAAAFSGSVHRFGGRSVSDKFPAFSPAGSINGAAALAALTLAPASVTVLKLALVPEATPSITSFTGTIAATAVQLSWEAKNDASLLHYTVERKAAGSAFQSIGVVPAKQPEVSTKNYQFLDTTAVRGQANEYRLKLTSQNGTATYSDTIMLQPAEPQQTLRISLMPNPVQDVVTLQTLSGTAQLVTISVVDAIGRTCHSEKITIAAGKATAKLRNLNGLQRGMYWLQVSGTGAARITIPFIKQ